MEWVNLLFELDVKKYFQEYNLSLQAIHVLDNAPTDTANHEDDILELYKGSLSPTQHNTYHAARGQARDF